MLFAEDYNTPKAVFKCTRCKTRLKIQKFKDNICFKRDKKKERKNQEKKITRRLYSMSLIRQEV